MEKITKEYLADYISENEFDLLSTQNKIFFKRVKKYHAMLAKGEIPLPIKIEGTAIVDGHHRYIAGHIFCKLPEKCEWIRPKANEIRLWQSVLVE